MTIIGTVRPEEAKVFDSEAGFHQSAPIKFSATDNVFGIIMPVHWAEPAPGVLPDWINAPPPKAETKAA